MARLSALEAREPDEAKNIAEMIDILRRKMARDSVAGRTLRDAHPKTTGVLRGKFVVAAGLPDELRVGIFAKARTFDCWIRTSNSSGKPRSDAVPDARGLALKLLRPRGGEAADAASVGQDFVLLDRPVMPLGTIALFREAMAEHLAHHEATFDFCVQLRRAGMAIEDAAVRWDVHASPLRKVATLHIPRQAFRTAKRQALGEQLAFSPGHSLPAHAPLGGLNRARTTIYAALSKFRHERDHRAELA